MISSRWTHRHDASPMTSCATPLPPAAIVAVVAGIVGYFLVLRGQTFAGHALSHVGFAGATGAVLIGVPPIWGLVVFTSARRPRHGGAGRAHQRRATSPSAWCCRSRSASACCSCISTPPMPPRRRRCCSATCWASTAQTLWTLLGLGVVSLAGAGADRPAAALRQPAAGAGGGEGRLARSSSRCCSWPSWRLTVARMRPDRRRAAGLHPDGGAGRGRRALDHAARPRRGAGRRHWRWPRPGSASRSPTTPTGRRASGSPP